MLMSPKPMAVHVYRNMLGPGSYPQVIASKYPGGPVLPKIGQQIMVTGRYLIEMSEMPAAITELHPVYTLKILP